MTTTVVYQICAEMVDDDPHWKVAPGTIRWLGSEHDNKVPHWTSREHAIDFQSRESAATFYNYGEGYTYGIYVPKPGTAVIVEVTTEKTVTEVTSLLAQ